MTVNEFVKSMAEAGFDFTFRATNGEITIVGESVKCKDGVCAITKRTITTAAQSRANIKTMFNKDKRAR